MRKSILSLVALTTILCPIALTAAPASANPGSPGCVTRTEYRQVHKGMTPGQVSRKFGMRGHRDAGASSGGYRSEVWSYKTCKRYSAVAISYSGYRTPRLAYKSAVWSY